MADYTRIEAEHLVERFAQNHGVRLYGDEWGGWEPEEVQLDHYASDVRELVNLVVAGLRARMLAAA